jgi:D-alanyl-D-alanine carboxypeptidase
LNNTNELLNLVDGIYGVKTGFTNGANRCLVSSCKRDELDIICVVLGADTKKDRTSDSIKLIEYAFNNFEMINLEDIITTKFNDWSSSHPNFEINKGISNNIIPKLQDIPYKFFPMNKTNISSIQIYIDCIYNFEAPIIKEAVIGTLTCYIDNNTTFTFNIYNAETINKKTIYDYFKALNNNFIFYLENSFLFS